jgi:hypothetical protein
VTLQRFTIEQMQEECKGQCVALLYGKCQLRSCYLEGGWDGKTVPVLATPTCIYKEMHAELGRHKDGT